MRERDVETYFVNLCVRQGWLCEKFTSPSKRGVPDRIVTAGPNGFVCFVELKKPGEKPRKLQEIDHKTRKDRGCHVFIVSNKYEARNTVAKIRRLATCQEDNDALSNVALSGLL